MSLVNQLLTTRTPLELAKELAATALNNAKLQEQIKRLEVSIVYLSSPTHNECEWHQATGDYYGPWESACGHAWSFNDGGPEDNHVEFCQGCGKPIKITGVEDE